MLIVPNGPGVIKVAHQAMDSVFRTGRTRIGLVYADADLIDAGIIGIRKGRPFDTTIVQETDATRATMRAMVREIIKKYDDEIGPILARAARKD